MASRDPDRLRTSVENPLRDAQRQGVREELEGRLRHRGAALSGSESDDEILSLANAVDAFERAVMQSGGDLMVDTPESSQPETPAFVIPQRHGDESVDSYVQRVREAAERISG